MQQFLDHLSTALFIGSSILALVTIVSELKHFWRN